MKRLLFALIFLAGVVGKVAAMDSDDITVSLLDEGTHLLERELNNQFASFEAKVEELSHKKCKSMFDKIGLQADLKTLLQETDPKVIKLFKKKYKKVYKNMIRAYKSLSVELDGVAQDIENFIKSDSKK